LRRGARLCGLPTGPGSCSTFPSTVPQRVAGYLPRAGRIRLSAPRAASARRRARAGLCAPRGQPGFSPDSRQDQRKERGWACAFAAE
jgi:hypothetical protein